MGTFLCFIILIGLFLSSIIDSSLHSLHMPKDSSGFEKPQAQYIINPCPEIVDGHPPQYCSQAACGGDTKKRGICDNIRLNGLQERRCQFDGGCGTYCRCRPDEYANGPSSTVQYIGIFCAESYGLPLPKCSEPSCGGDAYYEGMCSNILVSGAQGPACPNGGCGIFCRCDTSSGPDPPSVCVKSFAMFDTFHRGSFQMTSMYSALADGDDNHHYRQRSTHRSNIWHRGPYFRPPHEYH